MRALLKFATAVFLGATMAVVSVIFVLSVTRVLALPATVVEVPASPTGLAGSNPENAPARDTARGLVSLVAEQGATPQPALALDPAFEYWLGANGYKFQVGSQRESHRYLHPDTEPGVVVDVYPGAIFAWDIVAHESDFSPVMAEIVHIAIAAIESHSKDASNVRDAVSTGQELPLLVRGNGYTVLLEFAGYVTRSRVTFAEE